MSTHDIPIPPAARGAFYNHRSRAARRGIPFMFTMEEWWQWWSEDDKWSRRGRRTDELVMARFGDAGPYCPGNVYSATASQNLKDVDPCKRSLAGKSPYPDRRRAAA